MFTRWILSGSSSFPEIFGSSEVETSFQLAGPIWEFFLQVLAHKNQQLECRIGVTAIAFQRNSFNEKIHDYTRTKMSFPVNIFISIISSKHWWNKALIIWFLKNTNVREVILRFITAYNADKSVNIIGSEEKDHISVKPSHPQTDKTLLHPSIL
jgi:hypothetical protein